MINPWRFHYHHSKFSLQAAHTNVMQWPVPVVVIKTAKGLKCKRSRIKQTSCYFFRQFRFFKIWTEVIDKLDSAKTEWFFKKHTRKQALSDIADAWHGCHHIYFSYNTFVNFMHDLTWYKLGIWNINNRFKFLNFLQPYHQPNASNE